MRKGKEGRRDGMFMLCYGIVWDRLEEDDKSERKEK